MNKEPETYDELIRHKRCFELTKYYELTEEDLEKIYNYLTNNENGVVIGNSYGLTLTVNYKTELKPEVMMKICVDNSIDGIKLTNDSFTVFPHYVPVNRGSSGGR